MGATGTNDLVTAWATWTSCPDQTKSPNILNETENGMGTDLKVGPVAYPIRRVTGDESRLLTDTPCRHSICGEARSDRWMHDLCSRVLCGARDQDAHAPDPLGDHARRLGVQAGVVGYRSDRCRTRADGDEDGVGRAAAGVPAGRRGQAQGRPGTGRAVPLLAAAAEHDPQPLPDVQVNGPAAVRLGHRDFPVRCGGAWRRRWAAHCHTVPLFTSLSTIHNGATACKRGEHSHGDHNPDCMHITLTYQVSGRFRAPCPFGTLVTYVRDPWPVRATGGRDSPETLCPGVPGREGRSRRRLRDQMQRIRKDGNRMLTHQSRLLLAALALAAPAALASTVAAAAGTRPQAGPPRPALVLQANHPAPPGVRARPVGAVPVRVPNPSAYAAQKAAANAAAARLAARTSTPAPVTAALAPSLVRNWAGQRDTTAAPSDSTGAIGTTRYIELVNSKVAIYSRTSNTPTASGPLLQLTGCATSACTDSVFDVQVIWDPALNRFFYTTMDTGSGSSGGNLLTFGFSTTATPTLSASSWCRYSVGFGSTLPDYPKLGDTNDFMLIGTNDFSRSSFTRSTIFWVSNPPSGSTCPAPSTLKTGITGTLKNANGTPAFTPVPANQTDTSSTGWAVARPASIPSGGATFLTLFKVTKSATGAATIPTTGISVPVTAYKVPAPAPQPGTSFKLDTMDTRPTQAVSAIDPAHGSVTALWTQHTVFGGAGAQVRWYEINPATHSLIQNGTISSSSLYTFNGAISPDRRVNGTSKMFGGDMVITVNQSSASALAAIKVASKIGANPISALTLVAASTAADTGFDCKTTSRPNLCRWGDYAGASPDPAAPTTATTGQVWGTSMLSAPGGSTSSSGWTTRNFAVKP